MSKYVAINSESLKTIEASVIIRPDELLIGDGKYMDLIMEEAKKKLTEELIEALRDKIEYKTFKMDPNSFENVVKLKGRLTIYDGIKIPLSYVEDLDEKRIDRRSKKS